MSLDRLHYWKWFFKGSGGRPGYRRILNGWLLFHTIIGLSIAYLLSIDLQAAANSVLLPLAGVFVGLSFAWVGSAQALMQTREIDMLAEHHEGGIVEYVFTYQTAILIILLTLVLWGLAGLKVFDSLLPMKSFPNAYMSVKALLFTMASLTVRECWHVVMGAQWLLLIQKEIKKRGQETS